MFLIIWIICGIIGGIIGSEKGATFAGFMLGLLFGPLGIILALILKGTRINCPYCMKLIHERAIVCPNCCKSLNRLDLLLLENPTLIKNNNLSATEIYNKIISLNNAGESENVYN